MSISPIGYHGIGFDNFSSGYRITTASDNPAGLSIVEKLKSQTRGYDAGTKNALTGQDLLKVSDGALSSITDHLQRIRELSVQASNSAIYSNEDLKSMQDEVEQIKKEIQSTAKGTEFNTRKLLDGSMADLNLATNPQGNGMKIGLVDTTLETLGIANYDLTGDFDISVIDDALKKITDSRSSQGASYNAISYNINYNTNTSLNLTSATSKTEDLDYGENIAELKKERLLQQYQFFMQKGIADNQLIKQRLLL